MFRKRSLAVLPVALVLAATMALLMTGCSSKSTDDAAADNTTVAVTASPTSIVSGETSVVEATVAAGTVGIPDMVVTFSVTPSDAGYFTPAIDTTDATGVAATIFTATTSGSITITAGLAGTSLTATVGVAVAEDQSGGSGNISMNASPTLLLANGSDTSSITVTVRDELGQPAPDSTMIKIASGEKFVDIDGNGYWSEGIDSLVFDANANGQWDALGLIPSVAFTSGGTGNATVDFVSGFDAVTVYIKVTIDDNGISGSAELSLQLSPDATISSIYLASDSMQLSVKQTGGIETGLLRATGFDFNGNAVPEGLAVNFIIIDGPGGNEHLGNVGYGPYQAVTNSQGIATATIHSGTVSGTVRIRAYADTVLSNATQVLISAGPPAYIVVGAEKCNVDYWDNVAEENIVTAVVSDIYLNPVNDSTVVYFSTDEGTMVSHLERTKDHEGIASSVWFSGNNVATADGVVMVIAETSGGTVADTSAFFNTHFPAVISVTGWQTSLLADGEASFSVWVDAVDLNGNPVISGTAFKADAQYLKVAGGTFEDGCYSSSARVKVQSNTLTMDASVTGVNDDGVGAIDYVTYWHDAGASATQPCSLLTGYAYRGACAINAQSNAAVGEAVNLTVTIKDRWGNPLADHTLNMVASVGVVTGASQKTDSYGEAVGFTWTPGGIGTATITVTDMDPRGGVVLTHRITVE